MKFHAGIFALTLVLLTGCFEHTTVVVTGTSNQAPAQTSPTSAPDGNAIPLWMAPDAPTVLQEALDPLVKSGRFRWSKEKDSSLQLINGTDTQRLLSAQWVHVPVVAFPTIADNVKWTDIQNYWKGNTSALTAITGGKDAPVFVTTDATLVWLTRLLGEPSPDIKIEMVPPDAVVTTLWVRRPNAWSIVPFDRLDPAMKALTVDGKSVFDRALALDGYPLVETFSFSGDPASIAEAVQAIKAGGLWTSTNRDLSKMTILVMTGVTALTRATAYNMEIKGITLPAHD